MAVVVAVLAAWRVGDGFVGSLVWSWWWPQPSALVVVAVAVVVARRVGDGDGGSLVWWW